MSSEVVRAESEQNESDPRLDTAIAAIASDLSVKDSELDFSPQAGAKILELNSEYLEDLSRGAIGNARRMRADTVSASDVIVADATLRLPRRRARTQVLGTGGGIVLGAGLSQIGVALMATTQTQLAYLIALAFIAVSVLLFAAARYAR